MVLANWGNYPELSATSTIESVCSDAASIFTYTAPFTPSATQRIPMYGVKLCTATLRPDLLTDLGTVDLLRAMAKIEVKCSAEGFELSGVKLHRYNTKGYCAPTGVYDDTKTDWNYDEDEVCQHEVHIPVNSVSTSQLDFEPTADGFIAYVPEFDNTTNTAERTYIEVSLIHTDDKSPVNLEETNIYFCLYDEENGMPTQNTDFDIVRNHWYKYDITNVDDGKLIFQYKALPWQLVKSSIGYAPQHVSTSSNPFANETSYNEFINGNNYVLFPIVSYNNDRSNTQKLFNYIYQHPEEGDNEARLCILTRPTYDNDIDNEEHWALKAGSAGARYMFMLTGPEGATWEAHLTNKEDFSFSTTDENDFKGSEYESDGKVNKVTHGIARQKPYIIQIIANHLYTGFREDMSGDTDTDSDFGENGNDGYDQYKGYSKTEWEALFEDDYLTDWGKEKWDNEEVVETDFYITVKLTDGSKYNLIINPSFEKSDIDSKKFPFLDKRRFAGNDTHIWIRHLRAQYGWQNLEYLARDVDPNASDNEEEWDNFQWWMVNKYWNPNHEWSK